jgi:hypothetical protein
MISMQPHNAGYLKTDPRAAKVLPHCAAGTVDSTKSNSPQVVAPKSSRKGAVLSGKAISATAVRTELACTCTAAARRMSKLEVLIYCFINNVRRSSENIAAGCSAKDGDIRIGEGTVVFTQRTEAFLWIHIGAAKGSLVIVCVEISQKLITLCAGKKAAEQLF